MSQKLIEKHGYSEELFPPAPLGDGTVPTGNFYRGDKKGPLVPKHGNSLIIQYVFFPLGMGFRSTYFFYSL